MKSKKFFVAMTIIEVLMSLAIFTLGIQGCVWLFMRTWKVNKFVLETGQISLAGSRSLEKIQTFLRKARQAENGAYPVELAKAEEIIFFADIDNDGLAERIHLYKNNQTITMGVTKPTTSFPRQYPIGDTQSQILINKVINDNSQPIFSYFSKNYSGQENEIPLPLPVDVSVIRVVKIFIRLENSAPDGQPLEMQTVTEIRNLNDYDRLK